MECSACQQPIEERHKFCPHCGHHHSALVAPCNCRACGKKSPHGSLFCTYCGEALEQIPTTKTTPPLKQTGFSWKWALLSIPITLVVFVLVGLALGVLAISLGLNIEVIEGNALIGVVVALVACFLSGMLAAYWSQGITIWEPAIGLAAAVLVTNLLVGNTWGALIGWVIPFFIGMAGARIGERLQQRKLLAAPA